MKNKPPCLMILGASSSAGKSIIAAGLCRLFSRRGYNVAPFKAQNMSLNSWVTNDGAEMGVAQALQARACGLEPDARMNPVLLKPMGESGSQVILMGKPIGIMPYRAYIKLKSEMRAEAHAAFDDLCRGRDLMILEGAGSVAEINLRQHDIVNLDMAHYADAKCLLVADIDRGGAFASLAGSMLLLDHHDRKAISGFILNKFRGDKSLLDSALTQIEKICRRPFFGVLPMLPNLNLPEEDSAIWQERKSAPAADGAFLDVAIVDLPAISNITDWDALASKSDVRIRLVRSPAELGHPDLLILPGSRNVPLALDFLSETGLAEAIQTYGKQIHAQKRGNIAGICAGLEILGETIFDPDGIERKGVFSGLNLIPVRSRIGSRKIRARKQAKIKLDQADFPCEGYEIHHGVICASDAARIIMTGEYGEGLGFGAPGDDHCRIWGVWLHGLFDNNSFRTDLLNRLRREKGLPERPATNFSLDPALDRLADAIEKNLDIGRIKSLLGMKKFTAGAKARTGVSRKPRERGLARQ